MWRTRFGTSGAALCQRAFRRKKRDRQHMFGLKPRKKPVIIPSWASIANYAHLAATNSLIVPLSFRPHIGLI